MWLRRARHILEEGCLQVDLGEDVPWGLNWLFGEDPAVIGSDSLNQGSESGLGPEADVQTEGPVADLDLAEARFISNAYAGPESDSASGKLAANEVIEWEDDPVFAGSSLDTKYTWVQCENPHCLKRWKITLEEEARLGEEPWYCSLNPDPNFPSCDKDEEEFESWLDNLEQVGLQYNIENSAVYKKTKTKNQINVTKTRHGRKTK